MNPIVKELLNFVLPLLAREISVPALEATIVEAELTSPLSNPIPAIIANAASIFPDSATRPSIVAFLSVLQTKHQASLTA